MLSSEEVERLHERDSRVASDEVEVKEER